MNIMHSNFILYKLTFDVKIHNGRFNIFFDLVIMQYSLIPLDNETILPTVDLKINVCEFKISCMVELCCYKYFSSTCMNITLWDNESE